MHLELCMTDTHPKGRQRQGVVVKLAPAMSMEPQLGPGIADLVGGVVLVGMAAYAYAAVVQGTGSPSRPYPGGTIPETKLIGVSGCS